MNDRGSHKRGAFFEENAIKYLGVAKKRSGSVLMPDSFSLLPDGQSFEAVDLGGDILLLVAPADRARLQRMEQLAVESIKDHRKSLEGLAK